jgi:uncharacterized protein
MNSQKIALFGTPGENTQRLTAEALKRGHNVTAIVPNEREFTMKHANLKVMQGDARKKEDVSRLSKGHDVVICTYETSQSKPREHVEITRTMIDGVKSSGVNHLLSVAHPFGQPTERTEEAYNEFKPVMQAQQEALKLFKNEPQLQWGYIHSVEPKAEGSTHKYRTSDEVFFTNSEGQSRIPKNEYTSTLIDEVEKSEMEFHEGRESEQDEEESSR